MAFAGRPSLGTGSSDEVSSAAGVAQVQEVELRARQGYDLVRFPVEGR